MGETPVVTVMETKPNDVPPPPGTPAAPSTEVQSPFCGDLRSKKFFMLDVLPTEQEQYLDSSNHCWCYQTQQVVGPDGSPVEPDACRPGRSCYVNSLNDVA